MLHRPSRTRTRTLTPVGRPLNPTSTQGSPQSLCRTVPLNSAQKTSKPVHFTSLGRRPSSDPCRHRGPWYCTRPPSVDPGAKTAVPSPTKQGHLVPIALYPVRVEIPKDPPEPNLPRVRVESSVPHPLRVVRFTSEIGPDDGSLLGLRDRPFGPPTVDT